MHARGAGRSRPAGAALLLACLLGGLPPGQGRRACGGCGLAPRHRHTVADGLRLLATPPLGGLRLRGGGLRLRAAPIQFNSESVRVGKKDTETHSSSVL